MRSFAARFFPGRNRTDSISSASSSTLAPCSALVPRGGLRRGPEQLFAVEGPPEDEQELLEIKTVRLVPELQDAVRSAPWKVATLRAGFQPLPIKKAGCGHYEVDAGQWLALSGHDWTIVRLEDPETGKTVPLTPDTVLREGLRVIFLCSELATLKGYASYEEAEGRSRRVLEEMQVGERLPFDIRICRTDHAQKTGKVTIFGDNKYTVLKGAKLLSRQKSLCTFEYEPLQRLERNFGVTRSWSQWGRDAFLDVLRFRDSAVTPRKRIGLKKGGCEGLDLRATHGVSILGAARLKDGAWKVYWNPAPDFVVLPGDHCVALTLQDRLRSATRALFEGRARVSFSGSSLEVTTTPLEVIRPCSRGGTPPARGRSDSGNSTRSEGSDLTPNRAPGTTVDDLSFSPRLGPALRLCTRPPPFLASRHLPTTSEGAKPLPHELHL